MSEYLATRNFTVVLADKRMDVVGGNAVPDDLPDGRLQSLLNSGWIAPAGELGDTETTSSPADWRTTPVTELDLGDGAKATLTDAGLETIAAVLEYGAQHEGNLTGIAGVGEATQAKVQEAIKAKKPAE